MILYFSVMNLKPPVISNIFSCDDWLEINIMIHYS